MLTFQLPLYPPRGHHGTVVPSAASTPLVLAELCHVVATTNPKLSDLQAVIHQLGHQPICSAVSHAASHCCEKLIPEDLQISAVNAKQNMHAVLLDCSSKQQTTSLSKVKPTINFPHPCHFSGCFFSFALTPSLKFCIDFLGVCQLNRVRC